MHAQGARKETNTVKINLLYGSIEHSNITLSKLKPGSQYDVRRCKPCVSVYKNSFIEQRRTWLLKSSCLDVMLATQD